MAADHLLSLVRSRLSQIGIEDVSEHAFWQQKFSSTSALGISTQGWQKVYDELKEKYPLIDDDKRLSQFIKHSRMKVISSKKTEEPEPPEEIVAAIEEALKGGDESVLLQMESSLSYGEIVRALTILCHNTLNPGVQANEAYRLKLPYIISNEKTIEGMVSSGLFDGPKSIPLLNIWYPVKSDDLPFYQFFGTAAPKAGYRKISVFNEEFFIYRFRNNDGKEYLLFSRTTLRLEPSKITGMTIPQNDWVKVGELAKIPVATTIFFANKQESDIEELTEKEFSEVTKSWNFGWMEKTIFGSYLQPPWFEKMILAWLLSAKYSGYPLHLGILSPPGCLAGDTVVEINRAGKSSKTTMKKLIRSFNGSVWKKHNKKINGVIPTMIRARMNSGHIRLVPLSRAIASGKKMTYEILSAMGDKIRATHDHPFMTPMGWKKLEDLKVGDEVYVDGRDQKKLAHTPKKSYLSSEGLKYHPYAAANSSRPKSVALHRLIMEAKLNGLTLEEFIFLCRNGITDDLTFLDPKIYAVHHIDGNSRNNAIENLAMLKHVDHFTLEGKTHGWQNVTATTISTRIVSIKKFGMEETYDLTIAGEPHNFIANGFVVHNTGKTFLMEGLAQAVGDKVFGGGTIRGLVPSFGQAQPKEGYLAECRRVALIDEFLSIVKTSARQGGSEDLDSGTDKMLRIYEHKDEDYASGKGKIKIAPRMKVILVSNNDSYVKMKTLVDVANTLYPAFLSRSLWYVLTPDHKAWIDKNKDKVALLDRTISLAQRSPQFIRVMDYLGAKPIIKPEAMVKLKATIDEYHKYVPSQLVAKIYEPRALHQLICLTDGYAKVNSIIEQRAELSVTDDDIKEAASTFGNIIMSWVNEVKIEDVPIKHRHQFLPQNIREVYDYIEKNYPIRTPEILIRGYTWRQLEKLREYQMVTNVLDLDGTTCIWYPHWAKV